MSTSPDCAKVVESLQCLGKEVEGAVQKLGQRLTWAGPKSKVRQDTIDLPATLNGRIFYCS